MNTPPKLRVVIGLQLVLVILTLLFLFRIEPFNEGLQDSYKAHVGIFLLIFAILGLVGVLWKTKLGFLFLLTYQYFILFTLIISLFVALSNLKPVLILSAANLIIVFSIISFNNKEIKTKYNILSKAIVLNIGAAITGLLFSMAFLLFLAK